MIVLFCLKKKKKRERGRSNLKWWNDFLFFLIWASLKYRIQMIIIIIIIIIIPCLGIIKLSI